MHVAGLLFGWQRTETKQTVVCCVRAECVVRAMDAFELHATRAPANDFSTLATRGASMATDPQIRICIRIRLFLKLDVVYSLISIRR